MFYKRSKIKYGCDKSHWDAELKLEVVIDVVKVQRG